jgi:L-fuculose-phosphate aldolase
MRDMNLKKLVEFSRLLYERRLVGAAGGNVSMKIGEKVFITAGGKSLRDIDEEDIIEVDDTGAPITENTVLKPSKETALHLNVYMVRKDVDCVIHVHPVYATSFAVKGKKIPMLTASSKLKLIDIPVIGYADPGSKELSGLVYEGVLKAGMGISAVLLEAHGLLAFSHGIENCFNIAELAEETAKVAYLSGKL